MGDIVLASRVWRCIPRPGREHCRLLEDGLAGEVVIDQCSFSYRVVVDSTWRTRSLRVAGWVGSSPFTFSLDAPLPDGCIDVDLGFTPSTNTLPIRRLGLAIGEEASVSAAWLRYPGLTLERLDQTYRRLSEHTWRYSSVTGFTGVLEVDEYGMVKAYEGGWITE
ncbi:MAG TPA: putative glycolipid-binding domain-containing protein [Thermoanaerobaculia bacterium]|jgi:hypothetical protein